MTLKANLTQTPEAVQLTINTETPRYRHTLAELSRYCAENGYNHDEFFNFVQSLYLAIYHAHAANDFGGQMTITEDETGHLSASFSPSCRNYWSDLRPYCPRPNQFTFQFPCFSGLSYFVTEAWEHFRGTAAPFDSDLTGDDLTALFDCLRPSSN